MDTPPIPPPMSDDTDRDALVQRLFDAALGALETLTVYMGDRLGLYRALAESGPSTSAELAVRCGTDERYTREWLEQQAVAGFLAVTGGAAGTRRYTLPHAYKDVLLNRESLSFMSPLMQQIGGVVEPLPQILRAFRTGAGVPYADYGTDMRQGIGDANRALFINLLGREWLPAIPHLDARLRADPPAQIADVGCGTGWSSIAIARAYPKVRIDGFDLDAASVAVAQQNIAAEGLADRVSIEMRHAADPGLNGRYDLAIAIECIHDMGQPVAALRAMRELIRADGTVLIVDERVDEEFNAPGSAIERLYYGFSVLHCLPVGRVDQPSAATGTVMRPATLRRYAREAGFADIEVLPIEHDLWRFYRLLPARA